MSTKLLEHDLLCTSVVSIVYYTSKINVSRAVFVCYGDVRLTLIYLILIERLVDALLVFNGTFELLPVLCKH